MKLRNKKTGGIWDIPKMRHPTMQEDDISFFAYGRDEGCLFSYKSLAELNEEWEDYKPAEPLFTEKAARILRDWAELNGLEKERFRCTCINDKTITFVIWKTPNARGFEFDVPKTHASAKITVGTDYTIAELCGEEEE